MSEQIRTAAELDAAVPVMTAAVKASVRNIPGHVSDRAAEQIARAALHAFTPHLDRLLAEARAEGARAERSRLRVEIDQATGRPATCKVWYDGVLIFDGQDRSARAEQAAAEAWCEHYAPAGECGQPECQRAEQAEVPRG